MRAKPRGRCAGRGPILPGSPRRNVSRRAADVATPDLAADIAEQALEPVSTTTGDQSNTGRSIAELIQADQHLAAKRAGRLPLRGVAVTQLLGGVPYDATARDSGGSNPGGW